MRRGKGRRSEITETLNKVSNGEEDEDRNPRSDDIEEDEDKSGFFACYLLTSTCPRFKGHTYIGFTVNPRRRIRQHNGEICSGAWRTKKKRPWEMVLCIYGFPTNVSALQFEWAWQHPVESLAVRKAAVEFKSLGGLANKIKLAYTMLTLEPWKNLNLNVNFFSTTYTKHYAGCPTLPDHMKVYVRSMDELPCYTEGYPEAEDNFLFKFENHFSNNDKEEEPNRVVGSHDLDTTVPVLVPEDHHDNEKRKTTCVLDDEDDYERPSCSIGSPGWSFSFTPPQKSVVADYCGGVDGTMEDEDHHEDEKGKTCVLDDEDDYEQPSYGIGSPVWSLSITPPQKSVVADYCGGVGGTMEDENVKMDCVGIEEDGHALGPKGCGSRGEVEVIDLLSPESRIDSRRTKRRISVGCPEIVDLTQSPIYV